MDDLLDGFNFLRILSCIKAEKNKGVSFFKKMVLI